MSNKRFYWIKLKTGFFNLDEIDFLLSQKNGCEYIVLYQMLCLKTANNGGRLCTTIGEMLIPFDVEKIVRETKYFDFDTVTIALELFKKLGLIFEEDDNILRIPAVAEMVGSETEYAEKKRQYRKTLSEDKRKTLSDKSIEIEYRDKSKDIDINKDKENKEKTKRFTPPSLEEVQAYCNERNNNINPEYFVDYYNSNGWIVGKTKMKDWKATVRNWERREKPKQEQPKQDFSGIPMGETI